MSYKILVIDDEKFACALAESILSQAGYEVMVLTRAIGSTVTIKEYKPDLILLDVMMPGISGDLLADFIDIGVKPRPKILYYSNWPADKLHDLVLQTGVEGFVCKADGESVLLETVAKTLKGP